MTTVLALVPDAFGGRGGIAQYNRDFLGALACSPDVTSVEILTRHAADSFTPPAKVNQVEAAEGRITYIARALRIGFDKKPGIVFCGHINLVPLAALVARLCGARMVLQIHGIEAWERPGDTHRRAVERADLILSVSRYTRARLLTWAAIAPERVLVQPNTVRPCFTPGDACVLRSQWKLDGKRVLLTVARIDASERYKGHERVISALPALPRDVVYVVVGEGNDLERIKEVAYRAGVGERVYFKHAVDRDTLIAAYRMADLYVMPSTGEGFGIAFLEAMASGTPALGLAVAGANDALANGALGMTASETDFAEVLRSVLAAPAPPPAAISAAVRTRFGVEAFNDCVRNVVARFLEVT